MKTLSLITLGLWALVQNCNAAFAVYQLTFSTTRTGSGAVVKDKTEGYLFVDLETSEILILQGVAKRGVFSFSYPTNYVVEQVSGGLGKDTTVMDFAGSYSGSLTFKGVNSSFMAYTEQVRIPKSFKVSGTILKRDGDIFRLEEHLGTAKFDSMNTSAWNGQYGDFPRLEAGLRQRLLDKGYTEQAP